jgi:hypothetical protein
VVAIRWVSAPGRDDFGGSEYAASWLYPACKVNLAKYNTELRPAVWLQCFAVASYNKIELAI